MIRNFFTIVCLSFVSSALYSQTTQAACFASQQLPAQVVSADEKSFSIADEIRPCDGNGYQSSSITKFYVSVVRTQSQRLELDVLKPNSYVYSETNYHYYAGSMTWRGWQPVIITVQDANRQDLLPSPIFYENTPRDGCWYGSGMDYKHAGPIDPKIFDQIAFITVTIPRLSGIQTGC